MSAEKRAQEIGVCPDVSVIVVNWNTRELLRQCIESVRAVSVELKTETIVIDNASSDGSVDMVRNDFPEVRLIDNPTNLGFAAANNQGLACAKGCYVLLLNSDAVLKPGSLEKVWLTAEAHQRAGMVGCRVRNTDGTLQVSCMRYPDFRGMLAAALFLPGVFPHCRHLGYEDLSWWAHDDEREVEVLKGCFILVRADAIREIGALDESFWLFGEETDWCYRMRAGGWQVRFTDQAEIIHHGGASTDQLPGGFLHQLWGAKLQFVRKHRSPGQHALCCCAVWLWFAVRLVPSLAAAVMGPKKRKKFHQDRAAACASGLLKIFLKGGASLLKSGGRIQ